LIHIADHANSIRYGIEIETEFGSDQSGSKRSTSHLSSHSSLGIDCIDAAGAAETEEQSGCCAIVDTKKHLARLQTGDRHCADDRGRVARIEGYQPVVVSKTHNRLYAQYNGYTSNCFCTANCSNQSCYISGRSGGIQSDPVK